MNVFVKNGITIEIHYTNNQETEMMVYLLNYNKTYFISITDYERQLMKMKSLYITEIKKAIEEFLEEGQK